jgi:hypothetical protein
MHVWDYILIGIVSLQVMVAAYVYDPKWKALIMTLPFPFTFASLSVGQQVDAVNVCAMIAMFLFMQFVRVLHVRYRLSIYVAIGMSVLFYVAMGWALSSFIPRTELAFWTSCIIVFSCALFLYFWLPARQEPGDRATLALWIKLPMTVLLVSGLVWIKPQLQGTMTFFPMVGVFIAYEARKSLWTMGRQNTIVIMTVLPMLIFVHVCYAYVGLGLGLTLGWLIFLMNLTFLKWIERRYAHVRVSYD